MSRRGDTWYKREPIAFLDGVQGMGPELIGAYSVILDILYARGGDMVRDDRHLAGVLGCSIRKSRSLTDALLALGKIEIKAGKVFNERVEKVLKQRETTVKQSRNEHENAPRCNENNGLVSQNRIEENTPLTPLRGGRRFGVPDEVRKKLGIVS